MKLLFDSAIDVAGGILESRMIARLETEGRKLTNTETVAELDYIMETIDYAGREAEEVREIKKACKYLLGTERAKKARDILDTMARAKAAEEAPETTEEEAPIYINERHPDSNDAGILYMVDYETAPGEARGEILHTVDGLYTLIEGIKRNGYKILSALRVDSQSAREFIPETRQEKTDRENREHCKRIAEELEEYTEGQVYRCTECGSICTAEEDEDEDGFTVYKTSCGCCLEYEPEQLSVLDFIQDAYDIEYRVGSDREYRSVKIMVACGGPNIYIDTARRLVTLHWWTDYAEYPISSTACDALDEYMEECWGCM